MNSKLSFGVIATLIAVIALGVAIFKGGTETIIREVSKEANLGGITRYHYLSANQMAVNGVSDFSLEGSMVAGTSTDFWVNNLDATVWVQDLTVATDGTASSTFKISAEASSSPTDLIETMVLATPVWNNSIIGQYVIATSSTATSTSHLWDVGVNNKRHPVPIKIGERLNLHLQNAGGTATFTAVQTNCGSSDVCENATSTNRGFNVVWFAKLYSTSTTELAPNSQATFLKPFSQQ